ncbi:MAG: RsmE family RNA methyltransferase [Pelagibacteraceae bacterium]
MEKKIRIFLDETLEENKEILLGKEQSHYITNVMRLKMNDELSLFNGKQGEFVGTVSSQLKKETKIKIYKKLREQSKSSNISLAFCPPKGARLDLLIQKCTEVGLKNFIPVISDHTINRKINTERLNKVIIEACEQSDQMTIPKLLNTITFKDFIGSLHAKDTVLFADINHKKNNLSELLSEKKNNFILFIGPEGDFSSQERDQIKMNSKFKSFSLGTNILRSETAAISGLVLLNFLLP